MNKATDSAENKKEKPVNTPTTREIRKKIKEKAAASDMSMTDYLGKLLTEHWKNEEDNGKNRS